MKKKYNLLDKFELKGIWFLPAKELEPLILAILKPKNLRVLRINEMLANRVTQRLFQSSSPAIMDAFVQDIGKSSALAHLMVDLWRESHTGKK